MFLLAFIFKKCKQEEREKEREKSVIIGYYEFKLVIAQTYLSRLQCRKEIKENCIFNLKKL